MPVKPEFISDKSGSEKKLVEIFELPKSKNKDDHFSVNDARLKHLLESTEGKVKKGG